mmetsp:Transcript_36813/g.59528  ORF Transcript_36813/g.59528 Transcript_36813/m.59528 type:complete len:219 (+) Transcript_36813:1293-1949(+)
MVGCPDLTELNIIGSAFSADICRLSFLTKLIVGALDNQFDWPGQVFLDCLPSLHPLDELSIQYYNFSDTELTVTSPCLRIFRIGHFIWSEGDFELQKLHMDCPKLEELNIGGTDPYNGYHYRGKISDQEVWKKHETDVTKASGSRGPMRYIDFSVCSNLQLVALYRTLVHSLSLKWILDLVSHGRYQALISSRWMIIQLIDLLDKYSERLVCKERFNL